MAENLKSVWSRPSLIIFSTAKPTQSGTQWDFGSGTVLYLTDDNRSPLQINSERIESRKRMIDGTMRSVYVADKNTFSTSWASIPSRSKDSSRSYISEYERPLTDYSDSITSVVKKSFPVIEAVANSTAITMTNYIGDGTTTVIGTSTSHGLVAGDIINITGATGTQQTKLNGTRTVVTAATNTFTFVVTTAPTSGTLTTGLGTTTKKTVTYTSTGHNFITNDSVSILGSSISGYNGTFTIRSVSAGVSFTVPNATIGTESWTSGTAISNTSGSTATYTALGHSISIGDSIRVSGVSGGSPSNGYNGTFTVTAKTTNTFTVTNSTAGTPSSYATAVVKYVTHNTTQFGSGIDIKNWYDLNTDDFWILLVYDTSISNDVNTNAELYNVFFESFNYTVSKRGAYNDLWNVDISLVEV